MADIQLMSNPMTTAGDVVQGGASGVPARLAIGTAGQILKVNAGATALEYGAQSGGGSSYFSRRVLAQVTNTQETLVVNVTTYTATAATIFYHDWAAFPATHFHISCHGASSEAAQTVSMQLATAAAATNPVSALGDDLVVTNTQGRFSSGWIAVSDVMSGLTEMVIALKGSNTTVDFTGRFLDIAFKIA